MAEARFIKTVAFGGYDKAGVIRRMEYLNTQVHDLRNELRETKLLLEAYKKGTSERITTTCKRLSQRKLNV